MSSAFVVGYTGATGQLLVEELIKRKRFERLVLFGRRPFEGELPEGVESKVIDFDQLDMYEKQFVGFDQGFSMLGAWISVQGRENFVKIDRDATVKIAQMAKKGGTKHYHVISDGAANENSWCFYLRTKAQMEAGMIPIGFNRLSIYKPGYILIDRAVQHPSEHYFKSILTFISYYFPNLMTTKAEAICRAMIARSKVDDAKEPEICKLQISDIYEWSSKLED